jgi:hypothetical protein
MEHGEAPRRRRETILSRVYLDSLVNGDGRPSCSPQGRDRGDDQRVRGDSDCSRISGLEVEPLGLRAMREATRGEPIAVRGLEGPILLSASLHVGQNRSPSLRNSRSSPRRGDTPWGSDAGDAGAIGVTGLPDGPGGARVILFARATAALL